MSSQLETNLVSVERVNEYSNITTEVKIMSVKDNVKVKSGNRTLDLPYCA